MDVSGYTFPNIDNTSDFTYELYNTTMREDSTTYFPLVNGSFSLDNITNSQQATLRLYDIFIPLFGVFIIGLNLAVVVSSGLLIKKGQQPRSTYLFLGNVAMSDLVTGIAVVFGMLYTNRNNAICAIQLGMIVSSTLASVYSVGLIAVDRFLYILHGLQYQRWVYPFRARMCIVTSWLIGIIIGFLPLMGWAGDTQGGKFCWFILLAPKELIFLTIVVGVIPLLTVIVLYGVILYHAIKKIITLQRTSQANAENKIVTNEDGLRIFRGGTSKANVSDSENDDVPSPPTTSESKSMFKKIFTRKPNNNVNAPSKWKAIKVVMFTSGSFLFTWGPYFIASFMYTFCDEEQKSKKCTNLKFLIASPLAILGFLNSLINPIIYAWWHQGFRTFITKKFDSIRKKRRSNAVGPTTNSSKDTSSSELRKTSVGSSNTNINAASSSEVKLDPMK